jgi:hypothetical protein
MLKWVDVCAGRKSNGATLVSARHNARQFPLRPYRGRQLRMRMLTVELGGVIGIHNL